MKITAIPAGMTRWLVETNCHECFIDVESSEKNDEWKWISIGLLSTHTGWWNGLLGTRLREAWKVLRGGVPTAFDLSTAEEADELLAALSHARIAAFGYPPPFIGAPMIAPADGHPGEIKTGFVT
jgi:hypothetical protein